MLITEIFPSLDPPFAFDCEKNSTDLSKCLIIDPELNIQYRTLLKQQKHYAFLKCFNSSGYCNYILLDRI